MNREKIHKALALLNSMILSGEQHSETSQKILNDAVNELSAPQQVSVEPVVKVQIAEMVERHIIAHEQMKEQYLGKNLEMYSKAGGAILALEKLLKDLRKSNLSA